MFVVDGTVFFSILYYRMIQDDTNPMDEGVQNMGEEDSSDAGGGSGDDEDLLIPDMAAEKYPDLVELLKKSSSLNTEEKNYWLQMIPTMSEEQLSELRSILVDEKVVTMEAQEEYDTEVAKIEKEKEKEFLEMQKQQKKMLRIEAEKSSRQEETSRADALLRKLENM